VIHAAIQERSCEKILAHALKVPVNGLNDTGTSLYIRGWVLGRSCELTAVKCRLRRAQKPNCVTLDMPLVPRADVAKAYPQVPRAEMSGFDTIIDLLGLPQHFVVELAAAFADGTDEVFATIAVERKSKYSDRAHDADGPALSPLAVTSLGRSGSTWLMHLLSFHPEIIVYDKYPYEAKVNIANMLALKCLQLRPAADAAAFTNSAFWSDGQMLRNGPNIRVEDRMAYLDLLKRNGIGFHMKVVEDFYRETAERQGKASPQYFAEKYSGGADSEWELWPNTKELLLVRDLRDLVCSALAFNHKTQSKAFGRGEVQSDEEYVNRIREKGAAFLVDRLKRTGPRLHLVQYEKMIREPEQVLSGILRYLGLDSGPATIRLLREQASKPIKELEAHITAESPEKSIGRWKRDMSPQLARFATEAFGEALQQLGYENVE
jgi:hypothetical protein